MGKNKIFILAALFYFIFVAELFADILYLKNGRKLEGLIRDEKEDCVELDVGFGTVTFEKDAIERIHRSSLDEISAILRHWETEQKRSELMKAKAEEEGAFRPKEVATYKDAGHIIVDALLNKKVNVSLMVDTGATLMVLSPATAKKLRINIDKDGTPIKLITADGDKTDAKYIVLESVKVSDVEAKNIETAVLLDEKKDFGFKDGLLGMSFLRRFNFKFDHDQNKLILEKLK
jgi:clan AA aspartic protease (TIGR02281 family)